MLVDTAELLERLGRIRAEVGALEKLLRETGGDKSQARRTADLQETLNGLEAQLETQRGHG